MLRLLLFGTRIARACYMCMILYRTSPFIQFGLSMKLLRFAKIDFKTIPAKFKFLPIENGTKLLQIAGSTASYRKILL